VVLCPSGSVAVWTSDIVNFANLEKGDFFAVCFEDVELHFFSFV